MVDDASCQNLPFVLLYLNACVYLAPLRRYSPSEIMGSRPWPVGVTWRHRSPDYLTPGGRLPKGGLQSPCVSSTVMEIWPFEVLPGRLFQE